MFARTNKCRFRTANNKFAYYLASYARLFLPRFLATRAAPEPALTELELEAVQRRLAYYLGDPSAWNFSRSEERRVGKECSSSC